MNVFGQPNNFPPVLFHAWEFLASMGPVSLSVLHESLAPPSFEQTAHDSVRSTVQLGVKMGIFRLVDGIIENDITLDDEAGYNKFRRSVRDLYFDQGRHHAPGLGGAGNLQLASAWYFSFPPADTPGTFPEALQRLRADYPDREQDWPIPNSTQWEGFVRWMRFMGLAVPVTGKGGSTIRPSIDEPLLDTIIHEVGAENVALGQVLTAFTTRLPCFPGGSIVQLLPESARNRNTRNNALLAAALLALAERGEIILTQAADSTHREAFTGTRQPVAFDLIRRTGSR